MKKVQPKAPSSDRTAAERADSQRLVFELLKHVTTISSGSLLLAATFYSKLQTVSSYSTYLFIVFVCFAFAIVAAIVGMVVISLRLHAKLSEGELNVIASSVVLSGFSFAGGMATVAIALVKSV